MRKKYSIFGKWIFTAYVSLLGVIVMQPVVQANELQYCGYYKGVPFYNTTLIDAAFFQQCPRWNFYPQPQAEEKAAKDPLLKHVGRISIYNDNSIPLVNGTGTVIELPNMILTVAHNLLDDQGRKDEICACIFTLPSGEAKLIRKVIYFGKSNSYGRIESLYNFIDNVPQDAAILIGYEHMLEDGSCLKVYNAEESLKALTSERPKFYAGYPDAAKMLNNETIEEMNELFVSPIVQAPFSLIKDNPFYVSQTTTLIKLFSNEDSVPLLYGNEGASGSAIMIQEENNSEWKIAGIFVAGRSYMKDIMLMPFLQAGDKERLACTCEEEEELSILPSWLKQLLCNNDPIIEELQEQYSDEEFQEFLPYLLYHPESIIVYPLGRDFHEDLLPLAKKIAIESFDSTLLTCTEFQTITRRIRRAPRILNPKIAIEEKDYGGIEAKR